MSLYFGLGMLNFHKTKDSQFRWQKQIKSSARINPKRKRGMIQHEIF
jgi:hypothetical protein